MNEREFIVLITALQSNYKNFELKEDAHKDIWYEMLKDISYKTGNMAVKKLMIESPYPPTIHEIRKHASIIENGTECTAGEAWEEVLKAIRKHGHYEAKAALESLDILTRRATDCIGFKTICFSEKIGIERSHFINIYNQLAERERKTNMLPESFKLEMLETRERISNQISDSKKEELRRFLIE